MAKYEIIDGKGIIPAGTTVIERYAYNTQSDLVSVVIPDSVTEIGSYAFVCCANLKDVVIPDSVTEIGDYAFIGCANLTNVIIPKSVERIGDGAFEACKNLSKDIIPDTVKFKGEWIFNFCKTSKDWQEAFDYIHEKWDGKVGEELVSKIERIARLFETPRIVDNNLLGAFYKFKENSDEDELDDYGAEHHLKYIKGLFLEGVSLEPSEEQGLEELAEYIDEWLRLEK